MAAEGPIASIIKHLGAVCGLLETECGVIFIGVELSFRNMHLIEEKKNKNKYKIALSETV